METKGNTIMSKLYQNLLQLEKEENKKLQQKIRELTIDNELYRIRLKTLRENIESLSAKAQDREQSITIKQLNIYC